MADGMSVAAAGHALEAGPLALAAVRRADWRFLLPSPRLGRVAYVAPHEPGLVAALSLVSECLVLSGSLEGADAHDLVVFTSAQLDAIGGAHRSLRAGGWLYAEVSGRRARAWVRALERRGFEEISAHWLWPDARTCSEIVALEPCALMHAVKRRDPGGRLRPRVAAARLLVASGLFPLTVRRAAVLGRRR
jgi:hypothetical protein